MLLTGGYWMLSSMNELFFRSCACFKLERSRTHLLMVLEFVRLSIRGHQCIGYKSKNKNKTYVVVRRWWD